MSSNGKLKSLLRNSFKKHKTPYQSWEDEDSVLDYDIHDQPAPPVQDALAREARHAKGFTECFYLGSFDMSGRAVTGRGCIDMPAATIWTQSQEDSSKPRRKNSLKHSPDLRVPLNNLVSVCKPPQFVRLVATADDLEVYNDSTRELTSQFSFSKISFVGTHPKYSKLFVFIGVPKDSQTPFCHVFKCVNKEKADYTAESLSDIFSRKIQAIQVVKPVTI